YNGASVGNKNGWGQYSVSVVLDAMSEAGVKRVRDENRAIQNGSVSLTANTGSIVTTGPVGTVNPATQTLSPAGYDHNYRTWWVNADASGNTDITMTVTGATLQNPTFRIKSSGSLPTSVKYNSTLLTDGVDYFASYNSSASEVWITIVRSVTGTANLQVSSSAATTALMPVGKDMLKVYPNPFSGRVVVETTQMPGASGLCEVELINSLGQVIFSEKTSSPETEINTSSYPSGVYILRVKKENYVSNQSLVKL
ncbi:MAG: T9SS type A sorting domain-containing protein, partial [Cytophagaceae bacterium]